MASSSPTYVFSADPERVDRALVHRWLSEEAYWAKGRPREKHDAAMAASRNYGVYDSDTGRQVAYARVVTDGVFFAWLCDVFVDADLRGRGIGARLIDGVMAELDGLRIRRVLLATADAQGVYRPFGFDELSGPLAWMIRTREG